MQLFIVYLDIFFNDMSPRTAAAKTASERPDAAGTIKNTKISTKNVCFENNVFFISSPSRN